MFVFLARGNKGAFFQTEPENSQHIFKMICYLFISTTILLLLSIWLNCNNDLDEIFDQFRFINLFVNHQSIAYYFKLVNAKVGWNLRAIIGASSKIGALDCWITLGLFKSSSSMEWITVVGGLSYSKEFSCKHEVVLCEVAKRERNMFQNNKAKIYFIPEFLA